MGDDKQDDSRDDIERWRRATPDERFRAAAAMRDAEKARLKADVQARFPQASEAEVESRMGEVIFGVEVWRDICERRRRCFGGPGPA